MMKAKVMLIEQKYLEKKVKFVLGKPNFQHIDNNIIYFNIYLVKNTELVAKIGIFETKNTSYRDLEMLKILL